MQSLKQLYPWGSHPLITVASITHLLHYIHGLPELLLQETKNYEVSNCFHHFQAVTP